MLFPVSHHGSHRAIARQERVADAVPYEVRARGWRGWSGGARRAPASLSPDSPQEEAGQEEQAEGLDDEDEKSDQHDHPEILAPFDRHVRDVARARVLALRLDQPIVGPPIISSHQRPVKCSRITSNGRLDARQRREESPRTGL